ncbi:hypothetical protein F4678DRAFT_486734 [Xylaria arbuscula]|nr:hypothetical protein F4678DRAFT_486734 [Xylaria arbuscula]
MAMQENEELVAVIQAPHKLPATKKVLHKASKNRVNLLGAAKHFPPPPCLPPSYPPPQPPKHTEQLPRYSGLVIRDFSLPLATVSPNALVNPYGAEDATFSTGGFTDVNTNTITDANAETDADTITTNSDAHTGGWLWSHKRAHRRAISRYIAAAVVENPLAPHVRGSTESARTITETKASDGASAGVGVDGTDRVTQRVDTPVGQCLPKTTFLERCGKALNKKRSFWKKKEVQE